MYHEQSCSLGTRVLGIITQVVTCVQQMYCVHRLVLHIDFMVLAAPTAAQAPCHADSISHPLQLMDKLEHMIATAPSTGDVVHARLVDDTHLVILTPLPDR